MESSIILDKSFVETKHVFLVLLLFTVVPKSHLQSIHWKKRITSPDLNTVTLGSKLLGSVSAVRSSIIDMLLLTVLTVSLLESWSPFLWRMWDMDRDWLISTFLPQKKPYTAVTVQVDGLTSEQYEVDDLSGIVDLIEVVRLQSSGPTEAARAIRKKLWVPPSGADLNF